jgi:hypothetical protein
MPTLYLFDSEMISLGQMVVDAMAPIPPNSTLLASPRTSGDQVARFNGTSWEILTERPTQARIVPLKVTRAQARSALLLRGLFHRVQLIIDAVPDPLEQGLIQIAWDDALEFERYSPFVAMIGMALGLDDAGVDDLFIFAASRQ